MWLNGWNLAKLTKTLSLIVWKNTETVLQNFLKIVWKILWTLVRTRQDDEDLKPSFLFSFPAFLKILHSIYLTCEWKHSYSNSPSLSLFSYKLPWQYDAHVPRGFVSLCRPTPHPRPMFKTTAAALKLNTFEHKEPSGQKCREKHFPYVGFLFRVIFSVCTFYCTFSFDIAFYMFVFMICNFMCQSCGKGQFVWFLSVTKDVRVSILTLCLNDVWWRVLFLSWMWKDCSVL